MDEHRIESTGSLGADLRALRKARGLTLADLAARLGFRHELRHGFGLRGSALRIGQR